MLLVLEVGIREVQPRHQVLMKVELGTERKVYGQGWSRRRGKLLPHNRTESLISRSPSIMSTRTQAPRSKYGHLTIYPQFKNFSNFMRSCIIIVKLPFSFQKGTGAGRRWDPRHRCTFDRCSTPPFWSSSPYRTLKYLTSISLFRPICGFQWQQFMTGVPLPTCRSKLSRWDMSDIGGTQV